MKQIALGNEFVTVVDDDVFRWASLLQLKLHRGRGSKLYCYYREQGRVKLLHRAIMSAVDGWLVDHRSGDGLDNRRENLRIADHSQNAANRPPRGASGLKGVRWNKRLGSWEAYVRHHGRVRRKCGFRTAEEAGEAYAALASQYHGAFAWQSPRTSLRPGEHAVFRSRVGSPFQLVYIDLLGRRHIQSLRTLFPKQAAAKAHKIVRRLNKIWGVFVNVA